MIKNNEKIIVISGMAHSGTTILAYILQQHPEIYCFTNGDQACILENDLLLNKQNETIEFVINSHFPKRILLKRPWTECKVLDWFSQELPNARFIYCYKAFEDITKSWCKPTSWISEELRSASEEKQKNCYEESWNSAMKLAQKTNYFKAIFYDNFLGGKKPYVLVTCHRAENTDNKHRLENILIALQRLAKEIAVVFRHFLPHWCCLAVRSLPGRVCTH